MKARLTLTGNAKIEQLPSGKVVIIIEEEINAPDLVVTQGDRDVYKSDMLWESFDSNFEILDDDGKVVDSVEDFTPPEGHALWVKGLGQTHLSKFGESLTVCKMPMLGNNHKNHPQKKKCPMCWGLGPDRL